MQFELDDDLALLKSSTRELMENEAALADTRAIMEDSAEGFSKSLHAQLGELGYLSMLLSEEQGGMGALAFAAVLSEMGRVAFPGPYLDVVLAVKVLAGCAGAETDAMRARAESGEAIVVLARRESTGPDAPKNPETRFANGKVRGTKLFVPYGAHADALLVDTTEGLALVPRPSSGWNASPLPTIDHAQRFAEIELDTEATLVADAAQTAKVLDEADRLSALGASAFMFGMMERCVEMSVAYTMERQAFGAPIATFQSLQHRAADMLLQTESARSAAFRAAWATDHDPDEAEYLTAVAKAWCGPAGRFVCGQTIQLHGGVGYTWEYDPHIFLKRSKTLESLYGSTRDQIEKALQARGI